MINFKHSPIDLVLEQIVTGSTPSTSHPEYFSGAIPWFTPGDIGVSRELVDSSRHISEIALRKGKAKLFEKGMLLVTCIGEIGRVGVLQKSASSNQQITALKFNNEIDVYYAYYWCIANQYVLQYFASQAIIPILNNDRLREIEFYYPPLHEQKRIAAILAKADHLRLLRRYARELSDTYMQSVFQKIFRDPARNPMGWDNAIIGDVIASSQYGTSKASNAEQKGYPILGMGNLTYGGKLDLDSLSYVELSDQEFQELRLMSGDVIFNRTNSTELVGKTVAWWYSFDAVLASYLVKLKLTDEVLPDYFVALLNSGYYKRLFQVRCRKAVGQSNISPTLLKELPMLKPPVLLQEKFSQIVQRFEVLRAQQHEALRQAEHLFQTLLHKAFRGELGLST